MTTASEIVTRALRKIGVAGEDESAPAYEVAEAIDALNMMMFGWELQGIDTSHTALSESDTFPLDAKFEEGTVYLLAERLRSDYSRPVTFDADKWLRQLQAAYMVIEPATYDTALTRMPSDIPRRRGFT